MATTIQVEGAGRPTQKYLPGETRTPRHIGTVKRNYTVHVYPTATIRAILPGKVHRHPVIAERTGPILGMVQPTLR